MSISCITIACAAAMLAAQVFASEAIEVDFSAPAQALRREIHSSGWAPRSSTRAIQNDDAVIKSMNLAYARTHDWALVNAGQRVVDWQYVFPLAHLDAKDPKNYVFGPTDHLLSLARGVGLDIFYRLGTSIEHTGDVHFNALVPEDFAKTAEVFAGIVRHYNRGWADGHEWGIRYWEIWNEPDGTGNMWCLPKEKGGGDADAMRDRFVEFFVTVLKRLKSEFPDIKVGGPALCWLNYDYFRKLLGACRDAGVAPDFISWHYYGQNPEELEGTVRPAREMCDSFGFTDCELVINEYHYLVSWDGIHGENSTPEAVEKALTGPGGHNNIDAAAFYLTMLSRFQDTPLSQAYWYGCAHAGHWGYMDGFKRFNKTYYAAKMFGDVLREYPRHHGVVRKGPFTAMALESADGARKALLFVDYRSGEKAVPIDIRGLDATSAKATALDHLGNLVERPVKFAPGQVVIEKADSNSCAWLVEFECAKARASSGRWPGGKKAAFMLSFDDGCHTQVKNVFPLLEKYRIPGTFYVCPGWDSFKADEEAWANASEYVILGNHTYTHGKIPDKAALEKEFADCNAAIRRLRPNQKGPISFAIPGAESMHKVLEITDEELAEAYRRNNLVERFPWHGYPVQCKTVKEMEEYVDVVLASGGVGHMDFHGVGGDWLDPGLEYFTALLEKLDSRREDIWFTTHVELVQWLEERNKKGKR
jgi:peptidoglycan/xylan/chitin deacetylase (PgdA/CDA1 family)